MKLLLDRGGKVILDDNALANYRHEGIPVGPISWSLLNYKDALAAGLGDRSKKIPADDLRCWIGRPPPISSRT